MPPRPDPPPLSVARLFSHYPPQAAWAPSAADFLFARLLEDGAGEELAWLFAAHGEPAIAQWLRRRGGRALSRRSRAFWEIVLGARAEAPPAVAHELWPLA